MFDRMTAKHPERTSKSMANSEMDYPPCLKLLLEDEDPDLRPSSKRAKQKGGQVWV
jgi:hypothetical protein